MTKKERIAQSMGNPSRVGMIFVTVAEKGEKLQTKVMFALAERIVGRKVIRQYEHLYGTSTRPPQWWRIARWKPFFSGWTPKSGGWFWGGGMGIKRLIWISYGCGWGDPGTWRVKIGK